MATETTKKKSKKPTKRSGALAAKAAKSAKTAAVKMSANNEAKAEKSAGAETTQARATAKAPTGAAERFRKWSLWLGILYLLQGLAVVLFGGKASVPFTTQYLSVDTLASDANGHQVVAAAMRHMHDIRVAWIVAVILVILGAVHLLMAYMKREWHEDVLARGVNPLRSLGVALGGGAMVATIAVLGGISDIATLALLLVLTAIGGLLGFAAETVVAANNGKMTRFSHLMCGLAITSVVLPWLVFAGQIISAVVYNGHIPGYLDWVYGSMFVLFAAGLWATHQRIVRKGKWVSAAYTEAVFLALVYVAATAFTWQVFAGVMHS